MYGVPPFSVCFVGIEAETDSALNGSAETAIRAATPKDRTFFVRFFMFSFPFLAGIADKYVNEILPISGAAFPLGTLLLNIRKICGCRETD